MYPLPVDDSAEIQKRGNNGLGIEKAYILKVTSGKKTNIHYACIEKG